MIPSQRKMRRVVDPGGTISTNSKLRFAGRKKAKGPFPGERCRKGTLHKKSCASVSRVLFPPCGGPSPSIWPRRCRRDLSTYPPDPEMLREDGLSSFRQYGTAGIHGLSAREVYQAALSPKHWWALTLSAEAPIPHVGGPTFSSLPCWRSTKVSLRNITNTAVSLSAALSVDHPFPSSPLPVRKHAALRCPDFPLSALRRTTVKRCTGYQ